MAWVKDITKFENFHFGIAETFFKSKSWTPRQANKGYKFFTEHYIHDVLVHSTENVIQAKCFKSQKKNDSPHKLHIRFSEFVNEVVEAHCSCEAGNSQSCSHIVGLAYYLQHLVLKNLTEIPDVSCTSLPMEWNKPRGAKIRPTQLPGSVFFKPTTLHRTKNPVICRVRNPIRNEELTAVSKGSVLKLIADLQSINPTAAFSSTLSVENMSNTQGITLRDGISVPSSSVLGHLALGETSEVTVPEHGELPISLPVDDKEFVDILISLPPVHHSTLGTMSMSEASEMEKKTRKQSQSSLWKEQRKYRFTASKFGVTCKRRICNDAFKKQFVEPTDLSSVKAVAHGREHEPIARQLFLQKYKNFSYYPCGLIIHPYALHLGASPDGVLYDSETSTYGLLEIKCPLSNKAQCLDEYVQLKNFCMKYDENNVLRLKISHDYYYQVQGQMLVSGLRWAQFVVYISATKEMVKEKILFDPLFCEEMYSTLTNKYKILFP